MFGIFIYEYIYADICKTKASTRMEEDVGIGFLKSMPTSPPQAKLPLCIDIVDEKPPAAATERTSERFIYTNRIELNSYCVYMVAADLHKSRPKEPKGWGDERRGRGVWYFMRWQRTSRV